MISSFSAGQKSKLVLAGAFWVKPHMVAMDEPTNYLDMETVEALTKALKNFRGGPLPHSILSIVLQHESQDNTLRQNKQCIAQCIARCNALLRAAQYNALRSTMHCIAPCNTVDVDAQFNAFALYIFHAFVLYVGILVVTHSQSFVDEVCNEIWKLDDGKLIIEKQDK